MGSQGIHEFLINAIPFVMGNRIMFCNIVHILSQD